MFGAAEVKPASPVQGARLGKPSMGSPCGGSATYPKAATNASPRSGITWARTHSRQAFVDG
jgi:hypothetical protein